MERFQYVLSILGNVLSVLAPVAAALWVLFTSRIARRDALKDKREDSLETTRAALQTARAELVRAEERVRSLTEQVDALRAESAEERVRGAALADRLSAATAEQYRLRLEIVFLRGEVQRMGGTLPTAELFAPIVQPPTP